MRGMPSISARGGLKIYMESLGESYDVLDDIMRNDIIIYKAAHIRRALGNRYTSTTTLKWANEWINENKQGEINEKENGSADAENV